MKRWVCAFFIITVVFFLEPIKGSVKETGDFYSFFENSGAEFIKLEVEAHGSLDTDETDEVVAKNLFRELGYDEEYSVVNEDGMFILSSRTDDLEINIRTRKLDYENLIYASVTLSHYRADRNINSSIRRTITNAFKSYEVKPSFSSLILGRYYSKLSTAQMKKVALEMLKSSGVDFIDGMDEGNLVSITGYAGGIEEKIKVGNQYMNLNIALRASENDGCTYIWIGTPIIDVEY